MIPRETSGALEWNECRRLVSRLGANLDVVVRSQHELVALVGDGTRIGGQADCARKVHGAR